MALSVSCNLLLLLLQLLLFGTISKTTITAVTSRTTTPSALSKTTTTAATSRTTTSNAVSTTTEAAPRLLGNETDVSESSDFVALQFTLVLEKLMEMMKANREGFTELASTIAANSKKLASVIAANSELVSVIVANSKRLPVVVANTTDLGPAVENLQWCPAPWVKFRGLCLLFIEKQTPWTKAEQFCESKGGFLVWFENALEHNFVNDFLERHTVAWFHIGLFRPRKGAPLQWSSGSRSPYRSYYSFTNQEAMQFQAKRRSGQVDGDAKNGIDLSFLCRRPKK